MKGIVIGAGPSVLDNPNIIDKLARQSWLRKDILFFIVDRMLYTVDKYQFNPISVITSTTEHSTTRDNNLALLEEFYSKTERDNAKLIRCHFSCQVTQHFINFVQDKGFIDTRQDYHKFPHPCLREITALSPTFHDASNVGMSMFWIADHYYGIKDIACIGIDLTPSKHDHYGTISWDAELQQSIQASLLLANRGVKIYNCNPNHEGRFYTPIHESTLAEFLK